MKNPILIGHAQEMKPRFWVQLKEGKGFFREGTEMLKFLEGNHDKEFATGCDLLTDEEWTNLKSSARTG